MLSLHIKQRAQDSSVITSRLSCLAIENAELTYQRDEKATNMSKHPDDNQRPYVALRQEGLAYGKIASCTDETTQVSHSTFMGQARWPTVRHTCGDECCGCRQRCSRKCHTSCPTGEFSHMHELWPVQTIAAISPARPTDQVRHAATLFSENGQEACPPPYSCSAKKP